MTALVVNFRLDKETLSKLDQLAQEMTQGNRSELVRRLINHARIEYVMMPDVVLDDDSLTRDLGQRVSHW